MIVINKPWIEHTQKISRVNCMINVDDEKKLVWFEVEKKYGEFLCDDRADAYVIGLLHWAMLHNHDIQCNVSVTEELLYNINEIFIPALTKHVDSLNKISIKAEIAKPYMGKYVGTGCSCGVDSFDAIYNHMNSKYKSLDLTHLCINNVGAFNECYSDYGAEKVKEERYKAVDDVSKALSLEIIKTDSNFSEAFEQVHLYTHTYSSVFAIYMLQKMWKVYYYASSGIDYNEFSLTDKECAHYELLSLQCFSTSGLKIYSEGGEKERIDKTRDIINFVPAQKYLHVCLSKPTNCGICSKCRRTLLCLDALNGLNNFREVFDVDYYFNNKKDYYRWLYASHLDGDEMNEPTYVELIKRTEFKIECFKYMPIYLLKKIKRKITIVVKKIYRH